MTAIKNWFSDLFHHHKWEVLQKADLGSDGKYVGTHYHLQCSRCGKLKSLTLRHGL